MVLLSNLTALAAAASVLNIQDVSEQYTIDFSAGNQAPPGGCYEYTTIQNWSYLNNANQQWSLVGGPFAYQIYSPECNMYWAYLGDDTGALPLHTSIVARSESAASSFIFSPVTTSSGLWNIVETNSGLAVTAWNIDSRTIEPTAPVTLEALNASDTRQQFRLTTARQTPKKFGAFEEHGYCFIISMLLVALGINRINITIRVASLRP